MNSKSGRIPHLHPRPQSIHPTPGPHIYASPWACIDVDLQRPRWQDIACRAICRNVDGARAAAAVGSGAAVCMAAVWRSWLPGAVQDAAATQGTLRGAAGEHDGVMHGHRAGVEPGLRACAASNIRLLQQRRFGHAAPLDALRPPDVMPLA